MTALTEIAADLAVLVEQARWAHGHAYTKAGRGLTAEHGVDLSRSEAERLAGPTYDLEVGSHDARIAYQAAVQAVAKADVLLASLVEGAQPALVRLTVFSRPDELARVARNAAWRAGHVTIRNEKRVTAVRSLIDRAVRGLSKAMDDGPADGIAHGEKVCVTCGIRPQAERAKPDGTLRASKAGECDVCAQWRFRNQKPRPRTLDSGPLMEARAAQVRRRARGEDWGAA